jgi:hypothetical protein
MIAAPPGVPRIPEGHAYACMAVPNLKHAGPGLGIGVHAAQGFSATCALSLQLSEAWKHELGTKATGPVLGASIYLIRTSNQPYDDVRENLRQQVHFAYYAFLLSSGFIRHDPAYLISGTANADHASLKDYAIYPGALSPAGAPLGKVTKASIERSFHRAAAFQSLFQADKHPRFGRVLFAFRQAVTYPELDRRLHEFVRCTEGFIHPGQHALKRKFVERGQLMLGRGSKQRELLTHLWNLRSVTEHLHGPFREITEIGERARRLVLLRRAIEAESLARYSIETFLDRSSLWPHFESDATAESFWARGDRKRRSLWGEKLAIGLLDDHFDPDAISNGDLGILGELGAT